MEEREERHNGEGDSPPPLELIDHFPNKNHTILQIELLPINLVYAVFYECGNFIAFPFACSSHKFPITFLNRFCSFFFGALNGGLGIFAVFLLSVLCQNAVLLDAPLQVTRQIVRAQTASFVF